ncbi:MAG: trigger factor, partial [candidate division WOR-3 bacterium]
MAFTIKTELDTKKEVEFELGLEMLEDYVDKAIDDFKDRIAIDGFRKGKIPRELIKQKFYEELRDVALERLINDSYQNLLTEKNWQPVSEVTVKDIKTEGKINFTLEIETIPDFQLANYIGIDLVREKPVIDDRMVDERLEELRERYAKLVPVDRNAGVDDVLIIDYQLFEGDKQIEAREKIMIEIGDRRNNEDLNRALVGMSKNETKEFLITFEDRMVRYKVKVWEVKEKQRPLLSDEFARELKCSSLSELREKVRETLLQEAEESIQEYLLDQISQYLIDHHKFAVPENLVREEYQRILQRLSLNDSQDNWDRFRQQAEDRVRLQFVLNRIANREGIKATDEEIESLIKVQAALLQTDFEKLKKKVDDVGKRSQFAAIIEREKALKFILNKANVI